MRLVFIGVKWMLLTDLRVKKLVIILLNYVLGDAHFQSVSLLDFYNL